MSVLSVEFWIGGKIFRIGGRKIRWVKNPAIWTFPGAKITLLVLFLLHKLELLLFNVHWERLSKFLVKKRLKGTRYYFITKKTILFIKFQKSFNKQYVLLMNFTFKFTVTIISMCHYIFGCQLRVSQFLVIAIYL